MDLKEKMEELQLHRSNGSWTLCFSILAFIPAHKTAFKKRVW